MEVPCLIQGNRENIYLQQQSFCWIAKLQVALLSIMFPLNSLYSLPGSFQGQVGRGLEQPGLVEGVPVHGTGLELDDL